jgi:D-arabinose 1-dehydrogenase-like Zn-dependent alcohol dehydrogenase
MTEALTDTMRPETLQGKSTYRAVEVVSPGKWELTAKPVLDPPFGHVRIRVEACGVCHSDVATVDGLFPIEWPRVPGHEVVGRIDAIGGHVEGWTIGQRVGVGYLAGSCGHCGYCRAGDLVNCQNQGYTGTHTDGGYAEVMIASPVALFLFLTGLIRLMQRRSFAPASRPSVPCAMRPPRPETSSQFWE